MKRFSEWRCTVKQVVMHDFARKLMALLLALILYGSVTYKFKDIRERDVAGVNVHLELPQNTFCAQGQNILVRLRVSGSQKSLNRLTAESISGSYRLTDQEKEITLTPNNFQKPFGISIEKIEPQRISLELDRIITRKLPIRQVFDSEDRLPAEYRIRHVSVYPDEVAVTGPSAVIKTLQQVRTMPVPIDGTTCEDFDYIAPLQKLNGIRLSPAQVTIRVEIERKASGERSLSNLPYSLLMTPSQQDTLSAAPAPGSPTAAEVVVQGPDGPRNAMQKDWLRLYADLSDLRKPGEYVLPLSGVFVTPDARNLKILRITPEKLRVIVRPRAVAATGK